MNVISPIAQLVPGSTSLLNLEQHYSQPVRYVRFTVNVKFRLTISVGCFYISVIHLTFQG